MTDSTQLKFVNSSETNCVLMGIPGGGKTRCIIEKIVSLIDQKIITKSVHFLVLNFTVAAKNDMLAKRAKIAPKYQKYFNTANINTLHSLGGTVNGVIKNTNTSGIELLMAHLMRELTNPSLEDSMNIKAVPKLKACKTIFVDEAQDLDENMYIFINNLSKIVGAGLILVGDPNQTIYQFKMASNKYLLEHASENTYKLANNYRSSKAIVDFLNYFRPCHISPVMTSAGENKDDGRKPKVILAGYNSMTNYIIDELKAVKASGGDLSDIAIIGPVKKSKPKNNTYASFGLNLMVNLLHENDIDYIIHYAIDSSDDIPSTRGKNKRHAGHVNLHTIHGAKGLEFDRVFLINFQLRTQTRVPDVESYNRFIYLWYVGLSRAKNSLDILCNAGTDIWPELRNCPSKLYDLECPENYVLTFNKTLQNSPPEDYIAIMKLLKDRELITDVDLYDMVNMFEIEQIERPLVADGLLYDTIEDAPVNFDAYSALYGVFMEKLLTYYIMIFDNSKGDFITAEYERAYSMIYIPDALIPGFNALTRAYGFICESITYEDFKRINPDKLGAKELRAYNHLELELSVRIEMYKNVNRFEIAKKNVVQDMKVDYVLKQIKALEDATGAEAHKCVFFISLFYYHKDIEAKYLLEQAFEEELDSLEPYIGGLIKWAQKVKYDKIVFQKSLIHNDPNISGVADIIIFGKTRKIIEVKFSTNNSVIHALQGIMYSWLYGRVIWRCVEVWNLYTGTLTNVKFKKIDKALFSKVIAKILVKSP